MDRIDLQAGCGNHKELVLSKRNNVILDLYCGAHIHGHHAAREHIDGVMITFTWRIE